MTSEVTIISTNMMFFAGRLYFFRRHSVLLITFVLLLVSCQTEPTSVVRLTENLITGEVSSPIPTGKAGWVFGFDRRLEPNEDVRQIASLINWLEERTGLHLRIYVTPRGGTVVDDICAERVDFAVVGTVSYLQANHRCGAHILVRGLNAKGEDNYRAAIIVPMDSPLSVITDLREHSFAFGAPNSTQGYLIPRLMFQQAGISLDELGGYTFHNSHTDTADAVTSGLFDAGGLQDTLALDLAQRGLVRVLALSDPYPSSGIIVGKHVPDQTTTMIKDALLVLNPHGANGEQLYQWDRTEMPGGFALANDDDYETLRQTAFLVGLLEP